MVLLILASSILLIGAGLCLLPTRNAERARVAIASQVMATALVLVAALPVLFGAPELSAKLAWAYPVGMFRMRLDSLGAFFLVWSLPMTLLGSLYAVGYMRPYFKGPRHLGVHFALLNLTSISFVLVYTGEHALIFLLGWEVAALAAWLLVIWPASIRSTNSRRCAAETGLLVMDNSRSLSTASRLLITQLATFFAEEASLAACS